MQLFLTGRCFLIPTVTARELSNTMSLVTGAIDGPADAGPADAGPADAGPADAGPADAGPADAGLPAASPAALRIDIDLSLVFNWLSEQLSILSTEEDPITPGTITAKIAIYRAKQSLENSLKELYQLYYRTENPLSDDQKAIIQIKLCEEYRLCTEGFDGRVKSLVMNLSCSLDTLTDALYVYRKSLVERAATADHNIHGYQRTFTVAERFPQQFGVLAVNSSDPFCGDLGDTQIQAILESTFSQYYSPWKIVSFGMDELKVRLFENGYRDADDERVARDPQECEIYRQIVIGFFELDPSQVSFYDIFDIDENPLSIRNIDWTSVARLLLKSLITREEPFFRISDELMNQSFFKYLDSDDKNVRPSFDDFTASWFGHVSEIRKFFRWFGILFSQSEEQVNDFSYRCFRQFIGDDSKRLLHSAIRWCGEFVLKVVEDIPLIQREDVFFTKDEIEGVNALLLSARYAPSLVSFILGPNMNLSDSRRFEILKSTNKHGSTPLMLALRYGPKAVPAMIIDAIVALKDEQHKFELLRCANNQGFTALKVAVEHHPEAVPAIIEAIVALRDEQHKFELLRSAHNQGWTALMIAAANHPEAVPAIIQAIVALRDEQHKFELLSSVTDERCTALMFAAQNHPGAVWAIIGAIIALEDEHHKFELLKCADNHGLTALMFAAANHPEAVSAIIQAIVALGDEQHKFKLLKSVSDEGCTALMFAIQNHPEAVPAIIQAIVALEEERHKFELLRLADSQGVTALMFAAANHPGAVPAIIEAIVALEDEQHKFELLRCADNQGVTALMFVACYCPEAVPAIIQAIVALKEEHHKFELLRLADNQGFTALMFAAANHPGAVPAIIEAIVALEDEQHKFELLRCADNQGLTALMLAAAKHPVAVPAIIQAIVALQDEQHKFELLRYADNTGRTALLVAVIKHPEVVPAILEGIGSFKSEQYKYEILKCATKNGLSWLMFAAANHPVAVPAIIDAIVALESEEHIVELLKCPDNRGWTVLMYAVVSTQPMALANLLNAIKNFSSRDIKSIFEQRNAKGANVMQLALLNRQNISPEMMNLLEGLASVLKRTRPVDGTEYDVKEPGHQPATKKQCVSGLIVASDSPLWRRVHINASNVLTEIGSEIGMGTGNGEGPANDGDEVYDENSDNGSKPMQL